MEFVAAPAPLPVATTVITAVPGATPATRPVAETFATLTLLDVYRNVNAAFGTPVVTETSVAVSPAITTAEGGLTVSEASADGSAVTVSVADATAPVEALAVIVEEPVDTPVARQIFPATTVTVATEGFDVRQSASVGLVPPVNDTAKLATDPATMLSLVGVIIMATGLVLPVMPPASPPPQLARARHAQKVNAVEAANDPLVGRRRPK